MAKDKLKKSKKKGSKKVRAEKERIARAALDLREAYATLFLARAIGVLEEREPTLKLVAEADAALDARNLTCVQVWDLINRFVGNEPGTWGIAAAELELVPELKKPKKGKDSKKAKKAQKGEKGAKSKKPKKGKDATKSKKVQKAKKGGKKPKAAKSKKA